jgi:hypothetical protein
MSEKLIPENVIIKKRGKPVNPNSLRQQKLASTEPVVKKTLGRPKKEVVEPIEPVKKKMGRPVVEGSLRQQKLANTEPKIEVKKGRPSKCDSVPPKNNVKEPNTFTRPIIEYIDIDRKFKLNSLQHVNPLLLDYSKINKNLFFDVMETLLQNRLSPKVKQDITKTATKNDLYIIFRKICSFAVFYGFTTAYEIEQSLILRIKGDLQTDQKALKRFEGFLTKNCIGKQGKAVKKESLKQSKNKNYKLQDLTSFYEVPIEGKVIIDKTIDEIVRDVFVGKNASIHINNGNIEVVDFDMDEEGNALPNKIWKPITLKKTLLKKLVKRITDAVKDAVDANTYKFFIKEYDDDPQSVYDLIIERLPEIESE